MTARETVLGRIRSALHDVPAHELPDAVPVAREYHLRDPAPEAEVVERFAERVAEYKASVGLVAEADLPAAIAEALRAQAITRLVVPADLPAAWLPEAVNVLRDHGQLSTDAVEACAGVLTGCALGIAQTGTIVLDHGPRQGRRVLSLLPDYHLCLIWVDQIVGLVPEAIARLKAGAAARRPLTCISGPSATSDIELNRVEGVHGPRTLAVLIVGR